MQLVITREVIVDVQKQFIRKWISIGMETRKREHFTSKSANQYDDKLIGTQLWSEVFLNCLMRI
jgi:hypothetical protein